MYFNEIGEHIAKTRKSQKISQAQLAQQLGMSRATISGIENGTVGEVGIRKILAICTVLGLEMSLCARSARPTLQTLMRESAYDA